MKTGVKIAVGVMLVLAVLIVGCFALTGGEDEEETQAITLEQFNSVKVGAAKQQVQDELGKSANAKELARIGIKRPQKGPSSCIYYPEKGKRLGEGRTFQFCFTSDKLGFKKTNSLP